MYVFDILATCQTIPVTTENVPTVDDQTAFNHLCSTDKAGNIGELIEISDFGTESKGQLLTATTKTAEETEKQ
jgi:hypothetical protein